jgi:hypothetical protein
LFKKFCRIPTGRATEIFSEVEGSNRRVIRIKESLCYTSVAIGKLTESIFLTKITLKMKENLYKRG